MLIFLRWLFWINQIQRKIVVLHHSFLDDQWTDVAVLAECLTCLVVAWGFVHLNSAEIKVLLGVDEALPLAIIPDLTGTTLCIQVFGVDCISSFAIIFEIHFLTCIKLHDPTFFATSFEFVTAEESCLSCLRE